MKVASEDAEGPSRQFYYGFLRDTSTNGTYLTWRYHIICSTCSTPEHGCFGLYQMDSSPLGVLVIFESRPEALVQWHLVLRNISLSLPQTPSNPPATMEVPNAAETNGATTSSFLHHLRIVSRFFYLPKLRDVAISLAGGLWGGAFGVQEEEEADLEAGTPEEAGETHIQPMLRTTSIERFETLLVKKLMPTFPATFRYFTLPGLLCLAQIKWQLAPHGFPSSTLHKWYLVWYLVCVTTLLAEFAASVAQWIISAACDHREPRILKPTQLSQGQPLYVHANFWYSSKGHRVCLE